MGPMGPWAQKVIFGFRDFWIFEVLGPLGPLGTQAHIDGMGPLGPLGTQAPLL